MKERAILAGLFLLCLVAGLFAALRMAWSIIASPARAWKLSVAFDQLGNAAANGDEDETISSRAAKARRAGRRWGCLLCGLLDRIDPDHCEKSIEHDEGKPYAADPAADLVASAAPAAAAVGDR
ncbi:hypothetical protein [Stutzerimonas kunmingensis]|uniref:hypothetical protein n=1 Tax=Stutzerimonas kunmingensis TaxID=1211807 RepID=UPI001CD0AF63|nr:hypothetical protein [Stutzerimonas kunmingensis]